MVFLVGIAMSDISAVWTGLIFKRRLTKNDQTGTSATLHTESCVCLDKTGIFLNINKVKLMWSLWKCMCMFTSQKTGKIIW